MLSTCGRHSLRQLTEMPHSWVAYELTWRHSPALTESPSHPSPLLPVLHQPRCSPHSRPRRRRWQQHDAHDEHRVTTRAIHSLPQASLFFADRLSPSRTPCRAICPPLPPQRPRLLRRHLRQPSQASWLAWLPRCPPSRPLPALLCPSSPPSLPPHPPQRPASLPRIRPPLHRVPRSRERCPPRLCCPPLPLVTSSSMCPTTRWRCRPSRAPPT